MMIPLQILIISYVEICSKPMAILLYDDFYVCVFAMFVLACHSGFFWRDFIFLWWFVCRLCEKLRSLLNWLGGKIHSMVKEKGKVGKIWKDQDEEEIRRLRSCWMMEKESKVDWERRWKEVELLVAWKPPSVTGLFQLNMLRQAWISWSRGHWIVLEISFISRHCNALDWVDK